MLLPEKFRQYADLVCQQLRWKRAQTAVKQEITAHLCDQRDALMAGGMDEDAAVEESIRRMGDAVEIGTGLDRVHRPKSSRGLLILTAALVLTGLGIKAFFTYDGDFPWEIWKMLAGAALGSGCFLGAYFMDFTLLGRHPVLIYAGAVVVILCAMAPGMPLFQGKSYYAVQLSLLLPVAFAALLYHLRARRYGGLLLALAGLALEGVCCVLVPSMTALLPVGVSGTALLFMAVRDDWFRIGKRCGCAVLAVCAALVLVLISFRVWTSAYLRQRLALALDPALDPYGRGFAGMVIRDILAGARLFGPGTAGAYREHTPLFLAQPELLLTDLIHRVGWIALFVILAAFAVFFALAIHKCRRVKNMLGRMVALSVILTLLMQVVSYVLYNLGICVIIGFSLPLVSYGNTALVVNMALTGFMLSVFRTGSLAEDAVPAKAPQRRRIRWNGGELTISFKKNIAS